MVTKNGKLYVIATPIGNLGDISFRAVEMLRALTGHHREAGSQLDRDREAVRLETNLGHELNVFEVPVVVVAGHDARVP